jgi:hypothetical protein
VQRHHADRQHQIDEVELPGPCDEAEQHDGAAHQAGADQHHAPRSEPGNGVADEHDQRGAEQVVGRRGAGDQRGRPAVQAMQLGEIDAMTVEPEAPREDRDDEARGDHAPAGVARRAFVDAVRGRY